MADPGAPDGASGELDRLRLENETLYGVVGLVGSSPDLRHVLDRVVDLLTKAASSHACFIYVLAGTRLQLRAASPVYAHLVGQIEFGVDEGLAGWAVRNAQAAFIRDHALDDPRTNHVPQLEEERFQSMVAVPIPSRAGAPLGVIVLHTVAPREFDESILNVLGHAGSLVAGAIENAQLYEEARRRVHALTELSDLSERIAAAASREDLRRLATTGVRQLLGCDLCQFYVLEDEGRLRLAAADPPSPGSDRAVPERIEAIMALLDDARNAAADAGSGALAAALGIDAGAGTVLAVPVSAGEQRLGLLTAVVPRPEDELAVELLRSVAHQIALALEKTELIERLTEENLARDLFEALTEGDDAAIAALARTAQLNLDRPALVLEVRPARRPRAGRPWLEAEEAVEAALRRAAAGTVCDPGPLRLRAIVPVARDDLEHARLLVERLVELAEAEGVVLGASTPGHGPPHFRQALKEASDAATVAGALGAGGRALFYGDMGAYRYLVDLVEGGGPHDHLREAVTLLSEYDNRRQAQLLATLETYLEHGRNITSTARTLIIHANTLRQRLHRIEDLTGLDLGSEDLLALHLAIKLGRLRGPAEA
jgi:DNA-binding PucR family transcriptional regulator